MKTLIVVASRHGSTSGIAEALADELRSADHTVDLKTVDDAPAVENYDAAIVGSAVYMGKWLPRASQFVDRHQVELATLPIWLFSSGPLGEPDPPAQNDPADIELLKQRSGARGHRTFLGKLDKRRLGLAERFIVWNVNHLKTGAVPEGDFRDWDTIRAWAHEIASALTVAVGAGV
jgi:menaquinone-dependent protoporphyrinogen oxidase